MNQLVTKRCLLLLHLANREISKNLIQNSGPLYNAPRAFSITSRLSSNQQASNDDFRPSEELAKERYDTRVNEDVDKKRARLLYQSRKRGMLENGVILSSFADKFLHKLDPQQLDQYDRLINLPTNDWDIYYWATRTKPTPNEFETPVMQMLREHLNSKVSNDSEKKIGDTFLEKLRPESIVMPAVQSHYDYDIDVREIDLVNYESILFDDRIIKLRGNRSVDRMTQWRKDRFVQRIRRVIPAPVSIRNLEDPERIEVYSQKSHEQENRIARSRLPQRTLIDTKYVKAMKHHHFLQYLLSSEFTDDALDYDDEAKAWSEIIWHRNYGTSDVKIAQSEINCASCKAKLNCCDHGLNGYLPKELFSQLLQGKLNPAICQRCRFSKTYKANLSADIKDSQYRKIVGDLKFKSPSIIVVLVDLTDFPAGIYKDLIELIGTYHHVIVVGNKLDLLPYDGPNMIQRVTDSLKRNLYNLRVGNKNLSINDTIVLSAKTGFGLESLISRILVQSETPKDVYILGSGNSGKSTLFSALLQSDLAAIRDKDLISRVSVAQLPGGLNMLKFPTNLADGWEIVLKRRKTTIIERNVPRTEKHFTSTTKMRQANMPHMSLLINRLEYNAIPSNEMQLKPYIDDEQIKNNKAPNLSQDHPLRVVQETTPLSATKDEFPGNAFCYQYPSVYTDDQLHELLTEQEKLFVFPNETIQPRKYSLRPLSSIFVAGLARLDMLTGTSNIIVTIFASKYLPIHVVSTKKADLFYKTYLGSTQLGIPIGDKKRMKSFPELSTSEKAVFNVKGREYRNGQADVVFSSIGWALIDVRKDQECLVQAFTPGARGIYLRRSPLLSYARSLAGSRKIRDTPLFRNSNYTIETLAN